MHFAKDDAAATDFVMALELLHAAELAIAAERKLLLDAASKPLN